MDKLQWFKFTPSDWMMGKIQRCPEITQARFMRLCCLYWNKECLLSIEDAEIEIDKEHLDILIAKKIIKSENEFVKIDFLDEQMDGIIETSEKRRTAVLKRWNKVKQKDTSVLQDDTSVLQSDTDKSRVEQSRTEGEVVKDFTPQQFLKWFNETRTKYLEIPSNCNMLTYKDKINLTELTKHFNGKQFSIALLNLCNDQWANENNMVIPKHFLDLDNFNKYVNIAPREPITREQKKRQNWGI